MEGIVQIPFTISTLQKVEKPKGHLHLVPGASGYRPARRMHHGCIIMSTPRTPARQTDGGLDLKGHDMDGGE